MEKRIFFGVDLSVNYADLIKAEMDPDVRQELFLKRQFKLGCFIREREYREGMIVVDRNLKGWWIQEIEGSCIEDMKYLVKDQDGKEAVIAPIEVVDFTEVELDIKINGLKYAICAAVGIKEDLPKIKRPYWFDLVDQIMEKEVDQNG